MLTQRQGGAKSVLAEEDPPPLATFFISFATTLEAKHPFVPSGARIDIADSEAEMVDASEAHLSSFPRFAPGLRQADDKRSLGQIVGDRLSDFMRAHLRGVETPADLRQVVARDGFEAGVSGLQKLHDTGARVGTAGLIGQNALDGAIQRDRQQRNVVLNIRRNA